MNLKGVEFMSGKSKKTTSKININNGKSNVQIVPVFKKPLDINKLRDAFLLLAERQIEKNLSKKNDSGDGHETNI